MSAVAQRIIISTEKFRCIIVTEFFILIIESVWIVFISSRKHNNLAVTDVLPDSISTSDRNSLDKSSLMFPVYQSHCIIALISNYWRKSLTFKKHPGPTFIFMHQHPHSRDKIKLFLCPSSLSREIIVVHICAGPVHLFLFLLVHFLFMVCRIHIGGGLVLTITHYERHVGSGNAKS